MKKFLSNLLIGAALLAGVSSPAEATEIVRDGTFQNGIGVGSNPSPWSDWTNAGIVRASAPDGLPGNYAAIPVGGDLFQRFSPLTNGDYQLTFFAKNESATLAALVVAVQQAGGTAYSTIHSLGLGKELYLPIQDGFGKYQIDFTVNDPSFSINELYFSNSYNFPEPLLFDSVNKPGTVVDIANVSLQRLTGAVPEPSIWFMLIAGFFFVGYSLRRHPRRAVSYS
ncbi:PEP-CTERM sorting domain-containing protein [Sphingomonas sp. 3P27F8]|uniref:PEP-CTERM sorting domain-containing protein n=1 Tax=Sphingomonas sp. 3P27F8 TaxID=2502213 RepID=UPI0010F77EAB|nr:PEP-CTERM sorting domain-containing protein [Sphingomonas sp. 3P27F8]